MNDNLNKNQEEFNSIQSVNNQKDENSKITASNEFNSNVIKDEEVLIHFHESYQNQSNIQQNLPNSKFSNINIPYSPKMETNPNEKDNNNIENELNKQKNDINSNENLKINNNNQFIKKDSKINPGKKKNLTTKVSKSPTNNNKSVPKKNIEKNRTRNMKKNRTTKDLEVDIFKDKEKLFTLEKPTKIKKDDQLILNKQLKKITQQLIRKIDYLMKTKENIVQTEVKRKLITKENNNENNNEIGDLIIGDNKIDKLCEKMSLNKQYEVFKEAVENLREKVKFLEKIHDPEKKLNEINSYKTTLKKVKEENQKLHDANIRIEEEYYKLEKENDYSLILFPLKQKIAIEKLELTKAKQEKKDQIFLLNQSEKQIIEIEKKCELIKQNILFQKQKLNNTSSQQTPLLEQVNNLKNSIKEKQNELIIGKTVYENELNKQKEKLDVLDYDIKKIQMSLKYKMFKNKINKKISAGTSPNTSLYKYGKIQSSKNIIKVSSSYSMKKPFKVEKLNDKQIERPIYLTKQNSNGKNYGFNKPIRIHSANFRHIKKPIQIRLKTTNDYNYSLKKDTSTPSYLDKNICFSETNKQPKTNNVIHKQSSFRKYRLKKNYTEANYEQNSKINLPLCFSRGYSPIQSKKNLNIYAKRDDTTNYLNGNDCVPIKRSLGKEGQNAQKSYVLTSPGNNIIGDKKRRFHFEKDITKKYY